MTRLFCFMRVMGLWMQYLFHHGWMNFNRFVGADYGLRDEEEKAVYGTAFGQAWRDECDWAINEWKKQR